MAYPDKINALVDVSADETLAAGGHAARHNDVNDALDELEAVFTAPAANELALRPDGSTERMRLTSGGSVLIGTTTPGSAAAGDLVVNGGVFLGGSAAANELDDYEEGTFTPSFTFDSGNGTESYNIQLGAYTKIGELVYATVRVKLSSVGSASGDVRIDGFPFSFSSNAGRGGIVNFLSVNFISGFDQNSFGAAWCSGTQIQIIKTGTSVFLQASDLSNNSQIDVSVLSRTA